jgi:hypothetical protein
MNVCTLEAAKAFGVHPGYIVREAFDYWERRAHRKTVYHLVKAFSELNDQGDYVLVDDENWPTWVEDYALNLLAGRCRPLVHKPGKMLSEGKK